MKATTGWQRTIAQLAQEDGVRLQAGDPRRVEAYARVGHGTLDRLGSRGLRRETWLWLRAVEMGVTTREEWDEVADSYGL